MNAPIVALILALLLFGCASFEVTDPKTGLSVKSSAYGRGCVAVDTNKDGTLSIIVAQDGTSDWSIGRMFAFIGELAAPIFGGNSQADDMEGPDSATGCAQILESGDEWTDEGEGDRREVIVLPPGTSPEDAAALRDLVGAE